MTKPTKIGFYWVKKDYGAEEWLPACLGNMGGVWVFGDLEYGDGKEVKEWGPLIGQPESLEIEDRVTEEIAAWLAERQSMGTTTAGRIFAEGVLRKEWKSFDVQDAQLRRLRTGMLALIEAGGVAGKTQDQALDEFAVTMGMGRQTLDAVIAGDFDAVRKVIEAERG